MKILQVTLLSLSVTVAAAAQSPEKKTPKMLRQEARSLLIALSTDARTFHDQTLRARSLARIADALWSVDDEQARVMFRKAWEAAEVADRESKRKLDEQINQQKTKTGGGYAVSLPPDLRREVLRLAARRDRVLGEELLEKLKTEKAEAAANAKQDPGRLNESLAQRLGVARELLASGDIERALQFADPALTSVAIESIFFLTDLRDKDPVAADRRYAALLASSVNNPQADANTVSLLASYIFTPRMFMIFHGSSISSSQMASTITPADVTPELRASFFQTAGGILLRPLPPPGQDPGTAGIDGKYLVIKRLLPFFEQYASAETVEALRTHLNAMTTVASESARGRGNDEWVNRGVRPDKPAADRERSLLDRIERAKTSTERDLLYIELATFTTSKGDLRARDFVSKIEESELRKQVQTYVDGMLLTYHVEKKQTEPALELVRKGELSHAYKVWALTQCAQILSKTDRETALQLVEEAATEARRIDGSDPSRPRAMVAVANALKAIDPPRAWDATFDAVKAANSAEGFSGEDGELTLQFQSKGQSSMHSNDVPDFDLEGIFKELANQDYDRAVELARGFQREGPRAVATIAIARAILEPKKK